MEKLQLKQELRDLIHRLDQFNWEHCNDEHLARLITEIKTFAEDLIDNKKEEPYPQHERLLS